MRRRLATLLGCALLVAGTAVLGQNPLAQVGLDEGSAQDFILKNLGNPSIQRDNKYLTTAYSKVPAGARGPLATQLYAWTKAYVSSPAFKKSYAAWREENKPIEKHSGTLDEEVKSRLGKMKAEGDASYKELIAAGMKAQAEQLKKMVETTMTQMEPALRMEVQEARVKDAADYAQATKFWQEYYPVDPMVSVAKHLREYMANTADVDFAAKQVQRSNGIGELEWVFVNEPYNKKSWQWKKSYEFGAAGSAAGRAAADAWLKELGSK